MAGALNPSAANCAAALGLTANNPGQYSDSETALTAAEASAQATWDISEIAYTLLLAETPALPLLPFISLGIAIEELIGLFGGGRPKFQDTQAVIGAYNESAYWPLHALASDLAIAMKNGAPISDSNPAIQAQFSAWKQGTITSIQNLAGWPSGPGSPGYWQLQRLINQSWVDSGGGQPAVARVVQAIDRYTAILACLHAQVVNPPPPPPGPPPGPPGPPHGVPNPPIPPQPPGLPSQGPCVSGDPNSDEILDLCNALNINLTAILNAIQNLTPGEPPGTPDACCTAVVTAIAGVVQQLTIIATALAFGGKNGPSVDLSGITAALQALVTAVGAYPPALEACCAEINSSLGSIANAIKSTTGVDVSGIVDALNKANAMADVPQAIIDAVANIGLVSAQDAQLAGGGPWAWINTLLHDEWRKLNHPPSPEEVAALKADPVFGPGATAVLSGKPMPGFKELLKVTPSTIGSLILSLFQLVMEGAFDAGKLVMQPAVKEMLAIHQNAIAGMVDVKPGDEANTASTLLTEAMTFGMAAHWAAYAAELVDPSKHIGLSSSAAMLAEFAGFDELMKGIIGVEVRQAISLPHTYKINAQARAMVPGLGPAMALMARRKIDQGTAETLLGYAGLSRDYVAAVEAGAYRPVQPRVIVNAFLDQPIDRPTLVAMLEDAALSPANVQLMADAIVYKSIANVRNSYLSALVTGYGKGVISDQELDEALTQFNFSTEAKQYVTSHVLILRREVLEAEAEKTVVPLVANGNITPDEGLQQLEAAGVQPWYAELQITLATTRANIHAAKLEAAAERKAELARQRNLTKAAVSQYQDGAIDTAGLTATLLALGLDASLVASIVAVQTATRQGRLRLVYDQLLSPADAKLLTEKVAAIAQQTKDQLITLAQSAAQLAGLHIDQPVIEALVARWAATLKKSPGAAVLLTP